MSDTLKNNNYKRVEWKNDETHLNASNLNNMESGIETAVNRSAQNKTDIARHEEQLIILYADENVKDSVAYKVKQASDILDDKINSKSEYFENKINEVDKSLNSEIDNVEDEIKNHIDDKANPHKVTAAQVGAYSTKETYSKEEVYAKGETYNQSEVKSEIARQIAISGGGSGGTVNVDTTLIIPYNETEGIYQLELPNISDIVPQNIKIIIFGTDNEPGNFEVIVNETIIDYKSIESDGTYKLLINDTSGPIIVRYIPNTTNSNIELTVSYLTEGGVEKLFDYVDIAGLSNLISCGTKDPDETITTQFYFKYSE